GNRSFQQFFDNQNLSQGATENYSVNWTPSAAGTYTLKAGVFGQNWSSLIYWSDTVATLTAGTVSVPATPTPPVVTSGDPISGMKLYVDPESPAATQIAAWNSTDPTDAQHLKVIAANSEAAWFGNWNTNVTQDVKTFVDAAANMNAVPTLVAYNIPQRDCGGYSAGGSDNPDGYKTWISNFAIGIGNRKAIVILEPDALAQISCLSSGDQATRMSLLSYAIQKLKSLGNTSVYIDAGNPDWISASDMASRLSTAGIAQADGFSLNVSNFYTNADNISYGTTLSAQVSGKHFVIDTSRNGNGSNGEWCNPSGRAIGTLPTALTGNSLIDAFLWIKRPGESDGNCNGGPSAGTWWPQYAVGLATNAGY
ncbi:MAG TPA: glycoside hydrolase family 6 protein, partial [Candidatus Paceibacterota bacterium]|nr:glycoside hydrolase family 6 protein [Candidatus Paceibacterota bacterium]